jgi:hypothetical protein
MPATHAPHYDPIELRAALSRDTTLRKELERIDCFAWRITPQFSGGALS